MAVKFDVERSAVESTLAGICDEYLNPVTEGVAAAAAYGLRSPGKRLRPVLLQLAYRACGGSGDSSLLSCAPEIIHAYSLIHDDLPCMDDDDMRRGQPTVHKVYGSGAALLAGAILIPIAVLVARAGARTLGCAEADSRAIVKSLLRAAGSEGMIGGQLKDLEGEGRALNLAAREQIHAAKTGALIVASLEMGAIAAGANASQLVAFRDFGRALGLAFQITDDVLDVTATSGAVGKTTGRDAVLGKSTYPALLGVDGAKERASALTRDALAALDARGLLTQELAQVANFITNRTS